jgi:hypothetical protein
LETAYQLHQAHYGPSRGYAKPHWIHTTVAVYTYDESKKTEGVKNKTTGYDYTKKQPKFVENKYPYGKPNPVTQLTTCIKIDQEKYAIKKAEKDEWQCMSNLVEWFHNMDLPKVDLYYMCADTHNYQEIDITLSNNRVIRQVVVGSGGTFDMDMIGERKQIINKQDDKYEFAPFKTSEIIGISP